MKSQSSFSDFVQYKIFQVIAATKTFVVYWEFIEIFNTSDHFLPSLSKTSTICFLFSEGIQVYLRCALTPVKPPKVLNPTYSANHHRRPNRPAHPPPRKGYPPCPKMLNLT